MWLVPPFVLAGACASALAGDGGNNRDRNYLMLTGSADWEVFRSVGSSSGQRSTFDAFRQRYSLDLAGSIWDYHFNRFLLGLDLFHDERGVDDRSTESTSIGYRASSTFFPNRPVPLRLFARRSTIDSTGLALGDSDRETAAWGAEWNLTAGSRRNARLQLTNTSYDLLAPVALRERRKTGGIELSQHSRRRETSFRYAYNDQRELVRDARFTRRDVMLNDRTRFDNGVVLVLNGTHTLSDARFNTGERDDLTQNRFATTLDVPRKNRVGVGFGYEFNENFGKFVRSTGHRARGDLRVLLGRHWEALFGVSSGTLESTTAATTLSQDTTGGTLGVRYAHDWSHVELATAYTLGVNRTMFDVEPDRTVTHHGFDLQLRVPLGQRSALFGSTTVRQNQNDVSGVGFTHDEVVARAGFETGLGGGFQGQFTAYRRDTTYDTFQFGVQDSTEHGIEGTLSRHRGSLSIALSSREGISEFIPDPSAGDPFLPGSDLVSAADVVAASAHWRLGGRFSARLRARYEDREFTSIGQETILSYHPELEWSPGDWRLAFGLTHYERDNSVSFGQDTLLLKASRRFF